MRHKRSLSQAKKRRKLSLTAERMTLTGIAGAAFQVGAADVTIGLQGSDDFWLCSVALDISDCQPEFAVSPAARKAKAWKAGLARQR